MSAERCVLSHAAAARLGSVYFFFFVDPSIHSITTVYRWLPAVPTAMLQTESDINSLKDILKAVNTSGKSITAGKFEEELMAKFTRHKEQQAIEEEKRAWASISAAAFDKAARALTLEKSL